MLEYQVWHKRSGSLTSQRAHMKGADTWRAPSFPLILKESRKGASGWHCSLNCSLPTWALLPPLLSHSHSRPLSFCDFIFRLIDSRVFFFFFFPATSSQLAEEWRPLRISIDVMSPNCSAFMVPLKLSEVALRIHLHLHESTEAGGKKKKKRKTHDQSDGWSRSVCLCVSTICGMSR